MPCFSPLQAYRTYSDVKGKKILWGRDNLDGYEAHKSIDIPCGQCIGCRLERSRQWACRLMAEAECHEKTSFLTLTYKEMPLNCSLNNVDFTLFMKRLRRFYEPAKLRFFQCGEYGERHHRPHHHCILYGQDFGDDRLVHETSQSGLPQFTSKILDDLWGLGQCTIGDVTFESAAYVARYALKKVSGVRKESHYAGRKPEFVTMSRRPGIGASWYEAFRGDVYPGDIFVPGAYRPATLPPKYFDRLLERSDPDLFKRVKAGREQAEREVRRKAGISNPLVPTPPSEESSSPRLMVRGEVQRRTIDDKLKRGVE